MKNTKLFGALIALLALGTVACNGPKSEASKSQQPAESSVPAAESSKPAEESSAPAAESSKPAEQSSEPAASSEPAQQSSQPAASSEAEPDWLTVVAHNWVEGTPAKNTSDKEYIPLTDGDKVGVKISIQNFTLDKEGTTATGMSSDGKINPGNDHNAYIRFRIVAPKAGVYQMVMRGKSSSNAVEKTLNERAFDVQVNGTSVDVKGDRAPLTDAAADFVAAPSVELTGQEDTIDITASDYRIQFDTASFVLFQEH